MPCRLLIIDDDESLGKTLLGILKKTGYDVQWARTGREGLSQLSQAQSTRPIGIALIDIRLPDVNGIEVFREARETNPHVDAVMMTGFADTDTAVRALNEGAFAYLQKPYNIDEVKALLARLAERQELKRQNRELVRQLQDANAELERQVEQRTRSLQAANLELAKTIEKLKTADSVKSAFVSMVSHELRTPLTVIGGFTETLIDRIDELKKDERLRYLEIIHADTLRLSRLIQNILDLSHIENKGIVLHPGPVDLRQLAQSVTQGLKVAHPGMRFELEFEDGVGTIVSDKDCVEQIFINLLSNAVKFSPENSTVRVRAVERGDIIIASVIDPGPGIPKDLREKVFEAFYRMPDGSSKKKKGTGLGLTITKAIIAALGGQIRVEDGLGGKGANFTFILPKKLSEEKQHGTSPAAENK